MIMTTMKIPSTLPTILPIHPKKTEMLKNISCCTFLPRAKEKCHFETTMSGVVPERFPEDARVRELRPMKCLSDATVAVASHPLVRLLDELVPFPSPRIEIQLSSTTQSNRAAIIAESQILKRHPPRPKRLNPKKKKSPKSQRAKSQQKHRRRPSHPRKNLQRG